MDRRILESIEHLSNIRVLTKPGINYSVRAG